MKTNAATQAFATLPCDFRRQLDEAPKQIAETFHTLLGKIKYGPEIWWQYKGPTQQLTRQSSVKQLINTVYEYLSSNAKPSSRNLLDNITLFDRDSETDNNG